MIITKIWTHLNKSSQKVTNEILLNVMYVLGIGITSIFSKILNKHFLQKTTSISTWIVTKRSNSIDNMF